MALAEPARFGLFVMDRPILHPFAEELRQSERLKGFVEAFPAPVAWQAAHCWAAKLHRCPACIAKMNTIWPAASLAL